MPDITANRHQGSPESWAAYQKAHEAMPRQRADVLAHISTAADHGLTAKECAAKMGLPLNHISGRFSELKAAGKIRKTLDRREGSAVHILSR